MKTLLVTFSDRTNNADTTAVKEAISLLNASAVYVDEAVMLPPDDAERFVSALSPAFDAYFVVGADKAAFNVGEKVTETVGQVGGDGFFVGEKFACVCGGSLVSAGEKLLSKLGEFLKSEVGKMTFRLFGESVESLKAAFDEITAECPSVFFNLAYSALDARVDIFYSDLSPKMQVDKAVKKFIVRFKNRIYAEEDVSLEKRLYDLLKLHRLRCSTAESMTGGAIAARIVTVDGASDVFYEGMVTYDTLAKERRLDVSHKTIVENTAVSSKTAYEMVKGLTANADVAISVTGYAGSSAHPDKDDGLCFIGIGVADKVEVYRFRFGKSRKENIDSAVNAALYLAIKTVQNTEF